MTIKEFAEVQHVSYESIRKKIKRYEKDLKGHIRMQGRTQYLDDFAIEFLGQHQQKSQIIIADASEEIEQLKNENKALLIKVAELQEQLLTEKDSVKLLQKEKIELLEKKNEEKPRKWWQRKREV